MFYLIQQDTWGERNFNTIINTLEKANLEYEVCRLIPYIHEIEFKTKRKDVWCFGAIKMAHVAEKYKFSPGSMYNTNHDYEVYSKYYKNYLLNNDALVISFNDHIPSDDKWTMFFARPTKDTKIFSGQVFMRHSWYEFVDDCLSNESINIEPNTKIVIAPLKEIQQEIRCWVVNGKVITTSQYKIGRRIHYQNMDHESEIINFAQKMVDIYQPAKAFVIDICRINNEFKIVEINCINCSGFYDMNFQKLLIALEEEFNDKIIS